MLANNMANASTVGYKTDREFYTTYFAPEALDGQWATLPTTSPVVEHPWTDFAQGVLSQTGEPLDVAISGAGFFVVRGAQGDLYTRNGNFRVSKDGRLTTQTGDQVVGKDEKPIRLDPGLAVEIDREGTIRQMGNTVGQLEVVDFADRAQLRKLSGTYFRYDTASQPPQRIPARIEQGRLENANFQPSEAAVRLVDVMRRFEMLQKAVTLGAEMNRRAIEEVAKTS